MRKTWTRRTFLKRSAAISAGALAVAARDAEAQSAENVPASIRALTPMTGGVTPITSGERRGRLDKARRLMSEKRIDAIVLEGGSSMFYFTGVHWGLSERPFVTVIPAKGELAWIAPGFEEARARELIEVGGRDLRTWQEDESPYRLVAQILKDRGIATGSVGMEERLRFFVFNGIRKEAPAIDYVSADAVTAGCRMIKSPAEIALMQRANDITIAAYKAAFATLREGMTQGDLRANIMAAYRALGATAADVAVSFGEYTAFPHGSITPQKLKDGDVVQVDDGCSIDGYQSDITRTTVFGTATKRQIEIWNLEKRAQAAAFAAAKPGVPCEAVDAAARKVITDAGFGPGYKVPGLPHRTGHGIGLDIHEWTNFVKGNTTPLAPGMCFSDEPMIAIYGEFGIRLEDCLYITETGAKFFTQPSPAIDRPFA
ncbi:MAG: aminopeptidase P family protein [Acidobacteria bacterium]|nr:aminopeptidase P family protein [Acidobacteriota bacterium]